MPILNFNAKTMEIVDPDAPPIEVSFFRSVSDTQPTTIEIDELIEGIEGGAWAAQVQGVRGKTLEKRNLPSFTVSGLFQGGHKRENLVKHSGLICMDFDADDNPGMAHRQDILKEDLAIDEFVRAAFVSAGGGGLAVFCRVEPERHEDAFDALAEYFYRRHGLVADKACRDVSRLRFVSWDTDIVSNRDARVFKRYSLARDAESPAEAPTPSLGGMTNTRRDEIAQALSVLSPDVYDQWVMVGMAIHAETDGIDGLSLWREWSESNDTAGKFDPDELGRKWLSFGSYSGPTVNMESVFQMAYHAGWKGPKPVANPMLASKKPSEDPLPVITGDQWALMEEAPRDPVIEGLFDTGDKGDVIAPSKSKKSFFVLQMALHIAAGRDWFGMEIPKPRKVLLLQMEIVDKWMHRRFNEMRQSFGLTQEQAANFHISNLRGKYNSKTMQKTLEYIQANDIDTLIADPLYKMSEGDETIAEFKPIMAMFDTIAEETGAAVVWVHHDAKGTAGDRDIRDRGAGSGVLGRDCDFRVVLTPQADQPLQQVVSIMPRNFREPDPVVVEFDQGFFRVIDAAPNPKTSKTNSGSGKRDPDTVTADEVFEAIKGEKYPSTQTQLRDIFSSKLNIPAGKKARSLVDRLHDIFEADSRLVFGDIPGWQSKPNPANRTSRTVQGWGTPVQFEAERQDREGTEIEDMGI